MKNIFTNWKTTAAGASTFLAATAGLLHDLSVGNYSNVPVYISGILGGIGLIFAKDHNVTGGTTPQ